MRVEENLNPEKAEPRPEGPKEQRTRSLFRLHCDDCGELCYVDAATFQKAASALEEHESGAAFCCDDCLKQRAEEEYAHSMC